MALQIAAAVQVQKRRGRKRAAVIVLDEAGIEKYDQEILQTHKRARANTTLGVYSSYWTGINEWYRAHKPDWCTDDIPPIVDTELIRGICSTDDGLGEIAHIFKRFLQSRRHATDKDDDGNPAIARVGTLSGYRTAWQHYIWNSTSSKKTGVPPAWNNNFYEFFKGLKNAEADRKQSGLLQMKEGKSRMTPILFRALADFFHKEGHITGSFNNSWSWNLMCRSFNVTQLHFNAIGWAGDCISVEYGQEKMKKSGGRNNMNAMLKHLFANPFEPAVLHPYSTPYSIVLHPYSTHCTPPLRHRSLLHPYSCQICPFVALGLLINHAPLVGVRKNGRLLPRDTFPKLMDQVLKRHPKEKDTVNLAHEEDEDREVYVFSAADQRRIAFRKYLEDHGIPFDEISTHSYRKGSATYTASGSTSAPPIVAICLRAGWKLGGVLNTYLSLESAGDRFVGRVCTLLPQLSKKFCVMSPRFPIEEDENDMVADENEALLAVIDTAMTGMFGDYRSHGGSFAAVLRHCLASLCFHKVRTPPYSTLLHLTPPYSTLYSTVLYHTGMAAGSARITSFSQ